MSAFRILDDFYKDVLSSYPPQGEALLRQLAPEAWRHIAFRYILSVAAMTSVSHIIEEAAAQSRGTAHLHVSFQFMSRFLPQVERYRTISLGIARGWIYGAMDVHEPGGPILPASLRWINTEGTPLVQYWFVIAYGPGLFMSLLAREISALHGAGRYYEGFYAFDRDISYQLLLILHMCFPEDVPMPRRPEELQW